MSIMKKRMVCFGLALIILFTFCACAKGILGTNGKDGEDGENGKSAYEIAVENGFQGDVNTWLISLIGAKGIPGVDGKDGATVSAVEKTETNGLIDTYTITFTDGMTANFTVKNGAKGDTGAQGIQGEQGLKGDTGATGNGIAKIEKTGTNGLIDTYTITFTDNSTTTFTVTNGAKGDTGAAGKDGVGISNIISMPDGKFTFIMTDGSSYEFGVTSGECDLGAHKFVVTIVSPTCTEKGYTVSTCSECGKTIVDDITNVTGHHYYNRYCVFCNAEEPYGTIEIDKDWYESSKNTFEIGTKEELAGLSYLVSTGVNFSGKTFI